MRSSLPGRHELGQNFLVDRAVLDRIVRHRSASLPRDLRAEDWAEAYQAALGRG